MQFIFIVCQVEGYQDAAADHLLLPRIELLTKKKQRGLELVSLPQFSA